MNACGAGDFFLGLMTPKIGAGVPVRHFCPPARKPESFPSPLNCLLCSSSYYTLLGKEHHIHGNLFYKKEMLAEGWRENAGGGRGRWSALAARRGSLCHLPLGVQPGTGHSVGGLFAPGCPGSVAKCDAPRRVQTPAWNVKQAPGQGRAPSDCAALTCQGTGEGPGIEAEEWNKFVLGLPLDPASFRVVLLKFSPISL